MLEFFKSIVAFIVRIADLRGQRVAQTGIGDAPNISPIGNKYMCLRIYLQ